MGANGTGFRFDLESAVEWFEAAYAILDSANDVGEMEKDENLAKKLEAFRSFVNGNNGCFWDVANAALQEEYEIDKTFRLIRGFNNWADRTIQRACDMLDVAEYVKVPRKDLVWDRELFAGIVVKAKAKLQAGVTGRLKERLAQRMETRGIREAVYRLETFWISPPEKPEKPDGGGTPAQPAETAVAEEPPPNKFRDLL